MSRSCTIDATAVDRQVRPVRGWLQRIIDARSRQAELVVGEHLGRLPDAALADLGLTARQIAELRRSGRLTWAAGELR